MHKSGKASYGPMPGHPGKMDPAMMRESKRSTKRKTSRDTTRSVARGRGR